jgi:SagB-type dehydrogenase family enzyme
VNRLLGLDSEREVALSVVALGRGAEPPPALTEPPPLQEDTEPLSARTVDYPLIRDAHTATALPSGAAARAWRDAARAAVAARALRSASVPPPAVAVATIDDAIAKRRSARRFAHTTIAADAFAAILAAATRGVPFDFNGDDCATLVEPYVIVHAVDGLAPGAYAYDVARAALEPLRLGDFRRDAGYLDLGQDLAADAAANVYLLADLDRVTAALGERGYRAAQLEGGIVGGKLYLAAYGLGLGATGLTFFDDEVTAFFSPHAAGKDVMFLVALGHAARTRP